jgi:hypothetical protein
MKKKFLECNIHGPTLFRCKRVAYQSKGKDKNYDSSYTEKCFKCIQEGRYVKTPVAIKKQKHIIIK